MPIGSRFPRLPRIPMPAPSRLGILIATLRRIACGVDDVRADIRSLKEAVMATKDEILADLADVKTLLVETGKDVGRLADKLDAAVQANDLSEVSAAVAELKSLASGIDARAEQSAPEDTAPVDEAPVEDSDGEDFPPAA